MIFRLLTSAYLLYAMIFSIILHKHPDKWFLFMTSCNYVIVIIYFLYGSTLSCYSVFCKIKYFRGAGDTVRYRGQVRAENIKSKQSVKMSNIAPNMNKMNGELKKSENINNLNTMGGSTSQLIHNQYSVDSIILGIEENSNRVSVTQDNDYRDLHHARLQENRLPSINSDVFIEPVKEMTLFFKVYWFFTNVALNLSFLVVAVYWLLLFPQQQKNTTLINTYLRIDRHGVILLVTIIEQMITKMPIRILHFIYPSIMFIIYAIYYVTYTKITGNIIYSQIDFIDNPIKATGLFAMVAFVIIPIIQVFAYWTIYRVKERLFGKRWTDLTTPVHSDKIKILNTKWHVMWYVNKN